MKPRPRGSAATERGRATLIGLLASLLVVICLEPLAAGEPAVAPSGGVATATASGDDAASGQKDILDMDVDQLSKVDVKVPSMDVEVTSVAKHESTVGKSPAAVFVVTQDMIRRSGATTIPDVLRLVPGMEVAQINSHTWAVSARGQNSQFANYLLVLVDGRSVYTPLFGGVYWDVQDMLLEDIERIEVIRGPGGTLWGANAVNGVVNIITKKAQDTQGTLITAGGGNWDRLNDGVRVGGNNGNGLYWRVYGKHFERGPEYSPIGFDNDSWRQGRGGFRVDWDLDRYDQDTLTVLGNYYGGNEGQDFLAPLPYYPYSALIDDDVGVSGANVLGRWHRNLGEKSDVSLQVWLDRTFRREYVGTQQINTLDVEFQHRLPLGQRHDVTWGLEYREVHDYVPTGTFFIDVNPMEMTTNMFSGFIQDEITLVDDELFFTVGTKLERSFFGGFQYEPTVRLLRVLDEKHVVWGAISRAVRPPRRLEEYGSINVGPITYDPLPTFLRSVPDTHLEAEVAISYEVGYRAQVTDQFAWDIAGYCTAYENVLWGISGEPFDEETYRVVPFPNENAYRAQIYGVEVSGQWTLSQVWRVSAWYSACSSHLYNTRGTNDVCLYAGHTPTNQARLQLSRDLGHGYEVDMYLRYVDTLPAFPVPAYTTMDLRLGYRPNKNWELALVGRNLLDDHHYEFGYEGYGYLPDEVRRTVFAMATLRR